MFRFAQHDISKTDLNLPSPPFLFCNNRTEIKWTDDRASTFKREQKGSKKGEYMEEVNKNSVTREGEERDQPSRARASFSFFSMISRSPGPLSLMPQR